jgi:hypothetical protein
VHAIDESICGKRQTSTTRQPKLPIARETVNLSLRDSTLGGLRRRA